MTAMVDAETKIKELEAEIEKLKGLVNDHGSRMKLFDYFAEKVDRRQIERGRLLQDVEERLVEIEKADRDLERMGDLEAAQDAERCRVTRLYKDIQRLTSQEDKIKELEGEVVTLQQMVGERIQAARSLENEIGALAEGVAENGQQVALMKQSRATNRELQSLQEKVEKLEEALDKATNPPGWAVLCADIDDMERRLRALEKGANCFGARLCNLEQSKPQDCPLDQEEWEARLERITSYDGGRTFQCQTCGNTLPVAKPQPSRREVIKRARGILEINKRLHCNRNWIEVPAKDCDLILEALTLAEQSLEGRE